MTLKVKRQVRCGIIGECTNGKLKSKTLISQEYGLDFAFAYLAFNPKAVIFSADKIN